MKQTRFNTNPMLLAGIAILLCSSTQATQPEPAHTLPTLDELLGLEDQSASSDHRVIDPNEAELERALSPEQAGKAFTQAVELMNRVSSRISNAHDLSITTQRLQEDILRKLDQVIESANENQSGGGGSSASSSQSQPNQQQPNQQQQSQEGQAGNPSNVAGESSMPAGSSNANPGETPPTTGVSWGALPARFRDALSQGITDHYSELYRAITEEYYKSLAEDKDQ